MNVEGIENAQKSLLSLDEIRRLIVSEVRLNERPVGSIYQSFEATNPASIFGGTWEKIEDKFLRSVEQWRGFGQEGGEDAHKLIAEECPPHRHACKVLIRNSDSKGCVSFDYGMDERGNTCLTTKLEDEGVLADEGRFTGASDSFGVDDVQPHPSVPRYIAVHTWRRVR